VENFVRNRGGRQMPSFARAKVADAMHPGVIGVAPDTDLETVARAMASHRIHAVVVEGIEPEGGGERLVWGIVSDLDLMRAHDAPEPLPTASQLAATEIVTVEPDDPLARAAQLMTEHDVNHLIVASAGSGRPLGVVSALDVAATIARGRA